MKLLTLLVCMFAALPVLAQEIVSEIEVRGNAKVEKDAILTILKTQKGDPLSSDKIREDIKALHELEYFSDIRVYKDDSVAGVKLIFEVAEKPAIISISYEGLEELKEEDIEEKIETKLYTIVNEGKITADLRIIEKLYIEKGFYLARASYKLDKKGENEVALTFSVDEGGLVQVGEVYVLGNHFYTDMDIISKLYSRPLTRMSSFSSPGSQYQDDFLKRDLEFISFYYKDQGFAKVKVAKPITLLDQDREFVRLTFEVEEGLQYYIGKLDVSGDLLFPKEELIEAMALKPTELFRASKFQKDVDMLVDKYGDLGYAFVDVNPITKFNDDAKPPTVDINYEITKGDKVYFGNMTVVGNTKTRDNVIRREFAVHDSELYSGTGLAKTKRDVERLGFFEEVQAIKNRDTQDQTILHYKFKVKEKPTGQLQAAIGFQPGQATPDNKWFGQGKYNEENQSGYGWKTSLSGRWNGEKNYDIDADFTNPRVNDSQWLLGTGVFLRNRVRALTDQVNIEEREIGANVKIGRKIIELIRGTITYQISKISTTSDTPFLDKFKREGIKSSTIFTLSRNSTNNYLDPTEGTSTSLSQGFTGGPILRGDFQYMESVADSSIYAPIDFSESYRTYFHLHSRMSYIYPMGNKPVPLLERYRLGGFNDLRGFEFNEIGPYYNLLRNPGGIRDSFNQGGDKQLFFQLEYFAPLIQEAGIKALLFADMGRVYNDDENIELNGFYKDFGFGFRWITPIAPFRFEWAYPIIDGRPGDMKFIFYLGY